MKTKIKTFLLFMLLFASSASSYAGDCTVITYHQPGLVEAVGNTAVNLVAGGGLMTGGIVQGTAGLITGYDRTVVIPNNAVMTAVYPYRTVPVYGAPVYTAPACVVPAVVPAPGVYYTSPTGPACIITNSYYQTPACKHYRPCLH